VSLSSLFEEKFDERKNNYFLSSSEEEDKEEDKKEGAKNETMESQQRKIIEENFSFRVLYQKKRSTQNFCLLHKKEQQSARSRVCVCVCVCRFRATRVNNTYTHRKKWRQTGCLVEETPRKRVVLSVTPKEIITRAKTKTVVSARQQICFPRKATSKTNETIHTIRKKRGEGERKSPNSF